MDKVVPGVLEEVLAFHEGIQGILEWVTGITEGVSGVIA